MGSSVGSGLMEKFKEDPRVQEILESVSGARLRRLWALTRSAQGMDVREYSQNVERMLDAAEKKSVEDYVSQQHNLVELHREIKVR